MAKTRAQKFDVDWFLSCWDGATRKHFFMSAISLDSPDISLTEGKNVEHTLFSFHGVPEVDCCLWSALNWWSLVLKQVTGLGIFLAA